LLMNRSMRPSRKAAGNSKTNQYELKFPRDNNLELFDVFLRNGSRVETWFPLDETQTESVVQTANRNADVGEFHFTCYWLDQPTIVQRYAESM